MWPFKPRKPPPKLINPSRISVIGWFWEEHVVEKKTQLNNLDERRSYEAIFVVPDDRYRTPAARTAEDDTWRRSLGQLQIVRGDGAILFSRPVWALMDSYHLIVGDSAPDKAMIDAKLKALRSLFPLPRIITLLGTEHFLESIGNATGRPLSVVVVGTTSRRLRRGVLD